MNSGVQLEEPPDEESPHTEYVTMDMAVCFSGLFTQAYPNTSSHRSLGSPLQITSLRRLDVSFQVESPSKASIEHCCFLRGSPSLSTCPSSLRTLVPGSSVVAHVPEFSSPGKTTSHRFR